MTTYMAMRIKMVYLAARWSKDYEEFQNIMEHFYIVLPINNELHRRWKAEARERSRAAFREATEVYYESKRRERLEERKKKADRFPRWFWRWFWSV